MGKVHRIILLTLGWEELPKAVSVYGAPPEERMREPVRTMKETPEAHLSHWTKGKKRRLSLPP